MNEWTTQETSRLTKSKRADLSWAEIAEIVGRPKNACRKKWSRLDDHPQPTFTDLPSPELDLDEWLDQIEKMQDLTLKARPHVVIAEVDIKSNGLPIAFMPFSCLHLGGLYVNYKGARKKLDMMMDIDRVYCGSHGDDWEGFPPDWAATVFNNLVSPELQKRIFGKLVEKMAENGKLLYSMWSNHAGFLEKKIGEDQSAPIFWRNGIPYFNSRGILKLRLDGQQYVLDLAHEFRGVSQTNPNHPQAKEYQRFPWADMIISAHRHKYAYQEYHANSMAYDAGFIASNMARLVQIGSAKDGLDPYTVRWWDRAIWDFETWPVFVLSAKNHKIHRVHDETALKWYLGRLDF